MRVIQVTINKGTNNLKRKHFIYILRREWWEWCFVQSKFFCVRFASVKLSRHHAAVRDTFCAHDVIANFFSHTFTFYQQTMENKPWFFFVTINHVFLVHWLLRGNHVFITVTIVNYVFYKKHDFQNHGYFVLTIVLLQ